ncbi:MAG: hypothetical protein ABW121_18310 [Candidatus Thiodiazotropha sp. 6PLUC7]
MSIAENLTKFSIDSIHNSIKSLLKTPTIATGGDPHICKLGCFIAIEKASFSWVSRLFFGCLVYFGIAWRERLPRNRE